MSVELRRRGMIFTRQKEQTTLQQQTEQKLQDIINRLVAVLPEGR